MFDKLTNKTSSQDLFIKEKVASEFLGIKFWFMILLKKKKKRMYTVGKPTMDLKLNTWSLQYRLPPVEEFYIWKESPYPYGDVFDVLYRLFFYQNLGVSTDKEPFFSLRAVWPHNRIFWEPGYL